jgi:formyltetrahydrofolate synthetase
MFYIETKNTPLEEIAKHFDGDAALVGGAAATEKGAIIESEIHAKNATEVHEESIGTHDRRS